MVEWPADTHLVLNEVESDVADCKIKELFIGRVPVGFNVEIESIKVELK